jgi:dihydroneopterin aldolase
MSDAIFVNGLVLHAFHGVMPYEAKVGQPFTLMRKAHAPIAATFDDVGVIVERARAGRDREHKDG